MKRLPKDWHQVNLKQLIEIEAIRNDKSLDSEPYPDITKALLILSVFTGIPYDEYEQMPLDNLKKDIAKLSFMTQLPDAELIKFFFHKGYMWRVNFDLQKLTAQQFISHYEITKDTEKILENANKLLAMYCVPSRFFVKSKMKDEQKGELLKDCSVGVIYPLVLFFCSLYPLLLEATKDYLSKANEQLKETMEKATNQDQQAI